MALQLKISVIEYQTIQVLKLQGFLAQLEVYKFKRQVEQAIGEGRRHIVVDMREVEFMDSAGIAVLIFLRKECMRAGGLSALVIPESSGIRKVLASANLSNFFPVHSQPEDALAEVINAAPGRGLLANEVAGKIKELSERLASLEQKIGLEQNQTQI